MMVLPKRLDVNIPPAVTAVAEAAVGRGAVLRAVASAVLQADAVEQSLVTALPLGPQKPAGGVTLPESFQVLAVLLCPSDCRRCEKLGADGNISAKKGYKTHTSLFVDVSIHGCREHTNAAIWS